jgi:hypothetical protein
MYDNEFESDRAAVAARGRERERDDETLATYDAPAAATGRVDAVGPAGMARLQRSAGNAALAGVVQRSSVQQVIDQPGKSLPTDVREPLERGFGRSLDHVQLHDDTTALESARDVNAYAYASGDHIVVPPGAPLETYAEEAEHTFQQRSGPVAGTPDGKGHLVSDPSDSFETAARDRASQVVSASSGGPAASASGSASASTSGSASVQRQALDELEVQRQADEPVVQRQDEAPEELEEEPELA